MKNALTISNVETISDDQIEILDNDAAHESHDVEIDALRASLDSNVRARIERETAMLKHSCAATFAKHFAYDFKTKTCNVSDDFLRVARDYNMQSFDCILDSKRADTAFNVKAAEKLVNVIRYTLRARSTYDVFTEVLLKNLLANRDRIEMKKLVYTTNHFKAMCTHRESFANVSRSDITHKTVNSYTSGTYNSQTGSTLRMLVAMRVLDVVNSAIVNVDFEHAIFDLVRA